MTKPAAEKWVKPPQEDPMNLSNTTYIRLIASQLQVNTKSHVTTTLHLNKNSATFE